MPILILPDARQFAWTSPKDTDVPTYDLRPDASLLDPFETDAHCVGYVIDGERQQPRIAKTATKHLPAGVFMHWCFLDVDNPNHEPWLTPNHAEMEIEGLLEEYGNTTLRTAGIYATRGGYRIVWKLDQPIPVDLYEKWCNDIIRKVELDMGIDVDPVSSQWHRLFRVPYATRDGVQTCHAHDMTRVGKGAPPIQYPAYMDEPTETFEPLPSNAPMRPTDEELSKILACGQIDLYTRIRNGTPLAKKGSRDVAMLRAIGMVLTVLDTTDPNVPYRILYASIAGDDSDGAPTVEKLLDRCEAIAAKQAETYKSLKSAPILLCIGKQYFVLDRHQRYVGPIPPQAVCRALEQYTDLDRSQTRTPKGSARALPDYLADLKGAVINDMVYYYGEEFTRFNQTTRCLEIGVCHSAPIKALHNPQIAAWLEALGGDQHSLLLDWLATVKRVKEPTCALYFQGPPSCGKGLFCSLVSSLWGDHRTSYSDVMGSFNAALLKCPIIVADEGLPAEKSGFSAQLRTLIGERRRPLLQKFMTAGTLVGAPRLIITANNKDALRITESLTKEDIEAIGMRILHIMVEERTPTLLPGRAVIDSWFETRAFAEHVAFLEATREISDEGRFLVSAHTSAFHEQLALSSGINQTALLLLGVLLSSGNIPQGVRCNKKGETVLVDPKALRDVWQVTLKEDVPDQRMVSKALASVSAGKKRFTAGDNYRPRGYIIPLESIIAVAKDLNVGDVDIIARRVRGEPISLMKRLRPTS